MPRMSDVASINQTGAGIRLPNFCNLGVMLRSLLVVNLFVIAAAGLIAGTVPTIGTCSTSRTMPSAIVDAVLQAIVMRRGE